MQKKGYEPRRGGFESILLKGMRVYLAQFYRHGAKRDRNRQIAM